MDEQLLKIFEKLGHRFLEYFLTGVIYTSSSANKNVFSQPSHPIPLSINFAKNRLRELVIASNIPPPPSTDPCPKIKH